MYGAHGFGNSKAEVTFAPVMQFENSVGVGGVRALASIMTNQITSSPAH